MHDIKNNYLGVLSPLVYSSLFSFALTPSEVRKFSPAPMTKQECQKLLHAASSFVYEQDGYIVLRGKESSIERRKTGQALWQRKYTDALSIARLLSVIPSIWYIGLSGSLATGSAQPEDDLDFFIITKPKTLFTTRLIIATLLKLLGKKRKRNDPNPRDTVCVNMLLDASFLSFSSERQDLYTARELAQMVPLFERGGIQALLFRENAWVNTMLPNLRRKQAVRSENNLSLISRFLLTCLLLPGLETLMRQLQLWRIRKHTTRETVTASLLAFHPVDTRHHILQAYEDKLQHLFSFKHKRHSRTGLKNHIDNPVNIFYTA